MLHYIKLRVIPNIDNLIELRLQKCFLSRSRGDMHDIFLLLTDLKLDKLSQSELFLL